MERTLFYAGLCAVPAASAAGGDKPFFIYLNYTITHLGISVPEDSQIPYRNLGCPVRPMPQTGRYRNDPDGNVSYAGMVSRLDGYMDRLVRALRENGLEQNTLILFSSDNGHEYLYWEFNEKEGPMQAVRFGDWKTIRAWNRRENRFDPVRLYRLDKDVAEENDLPAASRSRPNAPWTTCLRPGPGTPSTRLNSSRMRSTKNRGGAVRGLVGKAGVGTVLALALGGAVRAESDVRRAESDVRRAAIKVDARQKAYEINPLFFGVCPMLHYENDDAMADGVIEGHLRDLPIRFLRFPGGTESDNYLWDEHRLHDGTRWPAQDNPRNMMDTDRFIGLCRRIGAEPLICVNTELAFFETRERAVNLAADWVRYCNVERGYGVQYWEIGNEPYFYSRFDAREYAELFVEMAAAMKAVDPAIKVAAVGNWRIDYSGWKARIPAERHAEAQELDLQADRFVKGAREQVEQMMTLKDAESWWGQVLEVAGPHADLVSMHWYFNLGHLPWMSRHIGRFRALCREKVPGRDLPVMVTEWNVYKSEKLDDMERALAIGEAAGRLLDGGVSMANYWPLRCGGGAFNPRALLDLRSKAPTPNYHVLRLLARSAGQHRVASKGGEGAPYHFASVAADGTVSVFLLNRGPDDVRAELAVAGWPGGPVSVETLADRSGKLARSEQAYSPAGFAVDVPRRSMVLVAGSPRPGRQGAQP